MIIFTGVILHYEKEYLPTAQISDGIYAYQSGRDIGFITGDKIIAINGKNIERFKDVTSVNVLMGATLTINRNGKTMDVMVPDTLYRTYSKTRDFFIDAHNFIFTIDSVLPDMSAAKAGLKKNDKIISLDSVPVSTYGSFREMAWQLKGKTIPVKAIRNADTLNLTLNIDSTGYVGIVSKAPYQFKKYGLLSGIRYGIKDAMGNLWANVRGLGKIFKGKESASESIQGPIGIMKIYGEVWDWHRFWVITGLISVVLAFMNILPIPALDGGHVIFTLSLIHI
jgi:regulator of sigma E protease